jgi:RNA polymerase sigma factor (sigma-70 family)
VHLPPFQRLLDAHGDDVHRFCVVLVGPDEADDCFQETYLSALRAYPRLRTADNLKSWIVTIAHRKAIDHLRARARRPLASDVVEPRAVAPQEAPDESLWEAVARLPPKQRDAVRLRYREDLDYAEVAAALACSQDAARRSVHEGLVKLRKELSHDR